MAEDISNKALAVLLVVAIVISVVGTWSVIRSAKITGYATNVTTQTGTASLTVTGNLIIDLTDTTIDLGNLEIADTNRSENVDGGVGDFFEAENDGSVDMDVKAYNGTELWDTASTPTEYWMVYCNSTTDAGATCNETYGPVPADSTSAVTLIESLGNTAGSRSFKAGVNVSVPLLEGSGSKSGSVIFLALQA